MEMERRAARERSSEMIGRLSDSGSLAGRLKMGSRQSDPSTHIDQGRPCRCGCRPGPGFAPVTRCNSRGSLKSPPRPRIPRVGKIETLKRLE